MNIFNISREFYQSIQSVLFSGTIIFPEKIARCFDQIRRINRTINIYLFFHLESGSSNHPSLGLVLATLD